MLVPSPCFEFGDERMTAGSKGPPCPPPMHTLGSAPARPPAPPQGAPGGSGQYWAALGQRGTRRKRGRPTGRPASASGARASRHRSRRSHLTSPHRASGRERGISLFGGASSEVRRCSCSLVVYSRCVRLFYQKSMYQSLSIYLNLSPQACASPSVTTRRSIGCGGGRATSQRTARHR